MSTRTLATDPKQLTCIMKKIPYAINALHLRGKMPAANAFLPMQVENGVVMPAGFFPYKDEPKQNKFAKPTACVVTDGETSRVISFKAPVEEKKSEMPARREKKVAQPARVLVAAFNRFTPKLPPAAPVAAEPVVAPSPVATKTSAEDELFSEEIQN